MPQQAQSSLPLFDDPLMAVIPATPGAGPAKTHLRNGKERNGKERSDKEIDSMQRDDDQAARAVNDHLLAARRLARRMRRLRNQREEQTRTGQAICHHLKAMLSEARPSG